MDKNLTPMMRQYLDVKGRNPDSILFFRLGDFYEMFGDDAKLAAKELDITLTTRDKSSNPEERMPMCGVPYHSAEPHIAKLISKGYKVAICEQLEDPATVKGIVDRDVVRTITPGTLMESSMLDEGKSNYLCAALLGDTSALCFADLSTGDISVTEVLNKDISHIKNELGSFSPAECILGGEPDMVKSISEYLKERTGCTVQHDDYRFNDDNSGLVKAQFNDDLSFELSISSLHAVGALLSYIKDTQNTDMSHLRTLRYNNEGSYMELDINTMRNLELVYTLRTGDKRGSLLWVLDKTKTPMGRRMIRAWVLRPLLSTAQIKRRQSAVSELVNATVHRGEIVLGLKKINDIERLIGKIVYGNAGCRDLKALSSSITVLPEISKELSSMKSSALQECASMDMLSDVAEEIDNVIIDNPPFSVREGAMIKDGVDPEVDRLRKLISHSGEALTEVEAKERERTGKKLKVGFNRVFGYYIEIPRSSSDDVPDDYIRKQTLANCERFITQELKELETELLSANDNLTALEYKLFEELRLRIAAFVGRIQSTAKAVAELDVFCSLAETAVSNNYCMPEIDASGVVDIKDGRHPVVEVMQKELLFVPNDTFLDTEASRTAIITGPNMAGKSTYMRQTALIVLMAQIGSFIPARTARIGITDRIFTRIGASDDLSAGKSTFMVEMTEVAEILKNATRKSLLILDEIGRGTSTYDGMSVARAVLEHCADKKKLGAKTMFATHYHELTALESEIEGVNNYNISAKKRGDDIIFLRKIVPGGADDSYGIEVAGLAGVPGSVIKRAKTVLQKLENEKSLPQKKQNEAASDSSQLSLMDINEDKISERLKNTELNTLSPLEALSLLFELKKDL